MRLGRSVTPPAQPMRLFCFVRACVVVPSNFILEAKAKEGPQPRRGVFYFGSLVVKEEKEEEMRGYGVVL